MQRPRLAVLASAILALLFLAGAVTTPLLQAAGHAAAGWLSLLYAPVCHQMPERSLEIAGQTVAVCARCTGLYAGGAIGLFAAAFAAAATTRRLHLVWLAIAVAPSILDALLPWIGLPGLSNLPRLALAVPAGLVAALFLARGLGDLFATHSIERNRTVATVRSLEVPDG